METLTLQTVSVLRGFLPTTGNATATFDELVIRKKMRVYELEVQKDSSTNGSLWISDSCSGDIVEKIV